jgi:hypothetical protein
MPGPVPALNHQHDKGEKHASGSSQCCEKRLATGQSSVTSPELPPAWGQENMVMADIEHRSHSIRSSIIRQSIIFWTNRRCQMG